MDVLLVAAKKDKIADYTGVIRAGRPPGRSWSTSTPSRCRTPTRLNYGVDAESVVVLLNAGASAINMNIVSGDQSLFTRDISIGGNAYTEAVQKELEPAVRGGRAAEEGHRGRRRIDVRRRRSRCCTR